ncbi:MAG: 50S ribosomal protein L23 [candidate division WOR-3 bacterium]|nr:50S ribosomal protein L23 [candidate division WOR-3 bacterium]
MIDPTKVIIRPIVTEKSERLKADNSQYVFEVGRKYNKIDIKRAVEEVFRVKVEKVRVMNYYGKPKRMGVFQGRRSEWKKAIVTLKPGQKIESLER